MTPKQDEDLVIGQFHERWTNNFAELEKQWKKQIALQVKMQQDRFDNWKNCEEKRGE